EWLLAAARDEIFPCTDTARLEIRHEVPQRRPQDLMREAWEPGNGHAKFQMLFEREVAWKLALHEGKWTRNLCARLFDLLDRVRRLQRHPVDACLVLVGTEPPQAVVKSAIGRIARIALRHDHEIRIELVPHVDGGAVTRNGVVERHDAYARALRAPLAFDRLIIDPHTRDTGADTFAH